MSVPDGSRRTAGNGTGKQVLVETPAVTNRQLESLQKAILAGIQTERENLMPTCLDMLVEERCEKLYGELINRSWEQGVLIGQIRTLQQVFKLPVTPETDLKTLPIEQLRSLLQKVEATHGGTPNS
jgi:hypothetical protein